MVASVFGCLMLAFAIYVMTRKVQGKPVFSNLQQTKTETPYSSP